jgi:hypothetical protein
MGMPVRIDDDLYELAKLEAKLSIGLLLARSSFGQK